MPNKNLPEQDGKFWIINDHEQVLLVSEDEFDRIKDGDGSGFRRLKEGERVPVQGVEILAEAEARGVSPVELMSAPAFVVDAPDPKDIKALRRMIEKDSGSDEE